MIKERPQPRAYPSFALGIALTLGAAFALPGALGAQVLTSVLPVEPPSSLFATRLGDEEVEVLVQGFWEASLLSSGSFGSASGGVGFSAVPFLFTQTPDLYAFLRFRRSWIFEAYVTKDMSDNRFSLSFEGEEGDAVRFARLGNSGIVMPDYPFLSMGSPAAAFGVALSAGDALAGTALDAMLRWDGLAWKERRLAGGAEIVETTVSAGDQVRGRRFVLPGAPVESLTLVDTTSSGSRALAADEFSASLRHGLLLLAAEPKGELRASFVDEQGTERSLVLYAVSKDSAGKAVRTGSDYEARNVYAISDSDSPRRLLVRNMATGQPDLAYEAEALAPGLVQAYRAGSGTAYDTDAFKRPFREAAPWYYEDSGTRDYAAGEAFLVMALSSVASEGPILLEQGTVPGTIRVTREGVPSEAFSYDPSSRSLLLSPPPGAGELIELRYAVASDDSADGALAYGVGIRFPWLGLSWSAALGGRQPLFGSGYDEAGRSRPSWFGLSLGASVGHGAEGVARAGDDASKSASKSASIAATEASNAAADAGAAARGKSFLDAALALRFGTAGSAGPYRVIGMEDYESQRPLAAFQPAAGGDQALSVASAIDTALAAEPAFSKALSILHESGDANRVLSLSVAASSGPTPLAETRLVRYVDEAPLGSYERLSFYVRAQGAAAGVASGAILALALGDGQGRGARVELPLAGLGSGWRRIELDLSPLAQARAYAGDGSALPVAGLSGSYSSVATAGLVTLSVSGLEGGDVVLVDELCLEEARDGLAALGELAFALGDERAAKGAYLSGTASGSLSADSAVAARLGAGWSGDPASLSASWTPSLAIAAGGSAKTAMGLEYVAAVPARGAPTRLVDSFAWNGAAGRYGKASEAALALGPFGASASASVDEQPSAFSQRWAAALSLSGLASVSGTARLDAASAGEAGLGTGTLADWGADWLKAWSLVLPAAEPSAYSRRIEAKASILGSVLSASARRDAGASTSPASRAEARLAAPIGLGLVTLSPYYARSTLVERSSSSLTFLGDAEAFAADALLASALWLRLPVGELWVPEAFDGFTALAAGARRAEHRATLGLGLSRPLGAGLVDLVAPSSIEASIARVAALEDESRADRHVLSLSYSGGAANLFGASGHRPLLKAVAFDEYSYKTTLSVSAYASDGAALPSLSSNLAASLEGGDGWTLALTNDLSLAAARAGTTWSETAGAALALRPKRGWIGFLLDLALELRDGSVLSDPGVADPGVADPGVADPGVADPGVADPEQAPEGARATWVSDWLDDTLAAQPSYLERLDLKASLGQPSDPDKPLSLRLSFDYSARLSLAGALSLGVGGGLWQASSLGGQAASWSFGYRLSVEAKVTF